jgi:hypothetical protein
VDGEKIATDEEREDALSQRLLKGGVYLNPGAEWSEKPGWFRLVYSHDKRKVEEGARR